MKTFQAMLKEENPPADLSVSKKALWYLKRGDWDKAHDVLQEEDSKETSWVHGYLHKVREEVAGGFGLGGGIRGDYCRGRKHRAFVIKMDYKS